MTNNNNFSVQYTNASELVKVNNISAMLKKGAAVRITTFKETKMLKGNKANRNPFLGRVFELTTIWGWQAGTSYSNSVNNAIERSNGNGEYEANTNGWHTRFNDFFETDKATHGKYYLQLQKSTKQVAGKSKEYFLDGRSASAAEIEEIKAWLPKSSSNTPSTQANAGVTDENARQYILIKVEDIYTIQQGNKVYMASAKEHQKEVAEVAQVER